VAGGEVKGVLGEGSAERLRQERGGRVLVQVRRE